MKGSRKYYYVRYISGFSEESPNPDSVSNTPMPRPGLRRLSQKRVTIRRLTVFKEGDRESKAEDDTKEMGLS